MGLLVKLKDIVESLPMPLARLAARVPFEARFGLAYIVAQRDIERTVGLGGDAYAAWVLPRLRRCVALAASENSFYREKLIASRLTVNDLRTLEDFSRFPIITKDDFRSVPLERRVCKTSIGQLINTGGTSGSPLVFAIDDRAFAREWAHMHFVWRRFGYQPSHVKLTFRGRRLEGGQILKYNAIHNEYIVSASARMQQVVEAVAGLVIREDVRWLHGYPSLVAEFCDALVRVGSDTADRLRVSLHGVLLGSEFPASIYRDRIEKVLTKNVVSWYGHSEMAVLAWESARGIYQSIPSYGYVEVVPDNVEANSGRLVATSFSNNAHPFIRYDTGDRVTRVGGIDGAPAFIISEGRVGDFITDKFGSRHSLTAIIFGRHHRAFSAIRSVQVEDLGCGQACLVIVPIDAGVSVGEIFEMFDLRDLPIDWSVRIVEEPLRSRLGKVSLKIVSDAR